MTSWCNSFKKTSSSKKINSKSQAHDKLFCTPRTYELVSGVDQMSQWKVDSLKQVENPRHINSLREDFLPLDDIYIFKNFNASPKGEADKSCLSLNKNVCLGTIYHYLLVIYYILIKNFPLQNLVRNPLVFGLKIWWGVTAAGAPVILGTPSSLAPKNVALQQSC